MPTIHLAQIPTLPPSGWNEEETEKKTKKLVKRLGHLQELMYAEKKHSLLVVLQGMDGSGKDGAVHKVFDACRMTGIQFTAFKKPTEEEFAHDFLWRVHRAAPPKGMIGIFNRSHYEDILIQRVHKWIDMTRVRQRMDAINAFETLLEVDNNTHVFKFYLHISKEEQAKQLRERMEESDKYWKHNPGDWKEREHWDSYMEAYEWAINQSVIPWHICPVDKRWYRDWFIANTLVQHLEKLDMQYPEMATE